MRVTWKQGKSSRGLFEKARVNAVLFWYVTPYAGISGGFEFPENGMCVYIYIVA